MTAPAPCAAAVEAALNSEYCSPALREHWPAGYRDEQRERMAKRLTAAWPHLRRQVIGECRRAVLGSPLANWEAVDNILRALLADAGQPHRPPGDAP